MVESGSRSGRNPNGAAAVRIGGFIDGADRTQFPGSTHGVFERRVVIGVGTRHGVSKCIGGLTGRGPRARYTMGTAADLALQSDHD